ncbi:MAG: hypothetical protein JST09_00830 [Bacteroidetes bacterium]|nr:hypothetical protein [Bacteroidota bacterium]
MKRLLAVLLLLGFFATLIILPGSCRHEIANYCLTDPIKVKATKTDALMGKQNGSIMATATGGSKIQYSLNNGEFQDTGYFANLNGSQTYTIVARNSYGCTDTTHVDIGSTDPCAGVTVSLKTTKVDASPNQANGSITVTASGGTGFTYSLGDGSFQTSGTFNGLIAGNYTITAKNANGCTGTTQVTIGTNNPCAGVTIQVTATKKDPTLNQSDGTITASASGGTGFTYSLNGGAYQASGSFTGLAAGNYTVTAKSAAGCTGVLQVALGSSNPCSGVTITVSLSSVNPSSGQSNGSITATASGATGFTYSLNSGPYQSSGTFSGLAAGNYTVTAKSSGGCLGTAQTTLTATNPCTNTSITITPTVTDVVPCSTSANNGSISVTASGSSGYSYNLNGGAYQSTGTFNNLAAATYTIGVKDVNGCTNTASVTVKTQAGGPLFSSVKTLVTTRCSGSGCHTNGGNAAGYNFDTDCNIVNFWNKINSAAVTNGSMPLAPQAKLTAAEKQKITDWVNAGHTYSN